MDLMVSLLWSETQHFWKSLLPVLLIFLTPLEEFNLITTRCNHGDRHVSLHGVRDNETMATTGNYSNDTHSMELRTLGNNRGSQCLTPRPTLRELAAAAAAGSQCSGLIYIRSLLGCTPGLLETNRDEFFHPKLSKSVMFLASAATTATAVAETDSSITQALAVAVGKWSTF